MKKEKAKNMIHCPNVYVLLSAKGKYVPDGNSFFILASTALAGVNRVLLAR
jgi:hypothetical protein